MTAHDEAVPLTGLALLRICEAHRVCLAEGEFELSACGVETYDRIVAELTRTILAAIKEK